MIKFSGKISAQSPINKVGHSEEEKLRACQGQQQILDQKSGLFPQKRDSW